MSGPGGVVVDVHAHAIVAAVEAVVSGRPGLADLRALEARRNGPESLEASGKMIRERLPRLTDPVAVRARSARGRLTVTAATPGQPPATAEGEDALVLLRDLGVVMNAVEPPTLVTDDPMTLPLLFTAARAAAPARRDRPAPPVHPCPSLDPWSLTPPC